MGEIVQISVIMGVYNPKDPERFFRAVRSIVSQTFSDWELILYDDGSEEPYRQTIRQAADMDKRIVLIRGEKNRGLAYGLNQCLRRAVGRYIARMDDDDVAREDRLEKQLRFLELHPGYQWVGSNVELIDRRGVWGCRKVPAVPGKRDFLFTSPYIHPTVLFHKRVLQENGGYNTAKEYLLCEDYELFMRLHKRGYQGYNIQDTLLQYTEDYKAHKKRTYRRRIREMKMRYQGFRRLGILNGGTFHHVLRPLLAGAIPAGPRHYIKKRMKGWKGRKEKRPVQKIFERRSQDVPGGSAGKDCRAGSRDVGGQPCICAGSWKFCDVGIGKCGKERKKASVFSGAGWLVHVPGRSCDLRRPAASFRVPVSELFPVFFEDSHVSS